MMQTRIQAGTLTLLPVLLLLLLPGSALPAAASLRDPFARPAVAAPPAQQASVAATPPRLRAVILNDVRSLANIDGDVVAAGEVTAAGFTVLRIDGRGVLIARHGSRQLLTIPQGAQATAPPDAVQDKETP